jgi:hypothetical protein
MNQLRLYRVLVAAQIGLTLLSVLASARLQRTLPAPLQAYLQAQQDAPLTGRELAVGASSIALLALLVTAWIGLWQFWRIAPWLYLAGCVGAFLLVLGSGPTVETAIETALSTAWSAVGGVVLSMSFFSDLRGKFGAGRDDRPTKTDP